MNSYPISILNLPTRVENSLLRNKILTLDDLCQLNELTLLSFEQIGPKKIHILKKSIYDFLVDEQCEFIHEIANNYAFVDVVKVLSKYNKSRSLTENNEDFVVQNAEKLDINNLYLKSLYNYLQQTSWSDRDQYILINRLRFYTNNRAIRLYSLEEIANSRNFNITRERVRQLEAKLLNRIDMFISLHEVKNEILQKKFVRNVWNNIFNRGIVSWPDDADLIIRELGLSFEQFSKDFIIYYFSNRFFTSKKLEKINFNQKNIFIVNKDINLIKVCKDAQKICNYLNNSEEPVIEELQLRNQLEINFSTYNQSEKRSLCTLVEGSTHYFYHPLGRYVKKRRGVISYAFEILKSNQSPMHFNEVTDKINSSFMHEYSSRVVSSGMLASPLFHSIGGGYYALSSWGMEKYSRTRHDDSLSVKTLVEEYIKENGSSRFEDISSYIKTKRKASDYTIHQALSDLGCRQDSKKRYHWNNKKSISLEQRIYNYLRENGPSKIDEIILFTEKYRKYSKPSYYLRLNMMGCRRDEDGRYHLGTYTTEGKNNRSTIKNHLEEYLRQSGPVDLNQIYEHLSKQGNVSKDTIKSYLGKMGLKQDENRKYFLHSTR